MLNLALPIIIAAATVVLLGAALLFGPSIGQKCFGRRPGGIHVEGPIVIFLLPLATCIILSLVLAVLLFVASYFR
jgi:hypothetical protein